MIYIYEALHQHKSNLNGAYNPVSSLRFRVIQMVISPPFQYLKKSKMSNIITQILLANRINITGCKKFRNEISGIL